MVGIEFGFGELRISSGSSQKVRTGIRIGIEAPIDTVKVNQVVLVLPHRNASYGHHVVFRLTRVDKHTRLVKYVTW